MISRRRFSLIASFPLILGMVGCSDMSDATDAGDEGIGAAGVPSDQPELDPNEAYEEQLRREAEAAKQER